MDSKKPEIFDKLDRTSKDSKESKDSYGFKPKPTIYNDKDMMQNPTKKNLPHRPHAFFDLSSSIKRSITGTKELEETKIDYMSCRFDPDDTMLAAGTTEGTVNIYDVKTGNLLQSLGAEHASGIPTTCLRWRPTAGYSKTKNILVSGCADGIITHWHVASGKQLHKIIEENNQVLCLDYNSDGSLFASGGKDYKVRVYDENTKSVTIEFSAGLWQYPGHSNRVFSVKFLPDDPNLIISGGWDCTMHIWDMREGKSINSIYGPSISADSLDYKSGVILTGSWRNNNQLELWDFGTRKKISTIEWDQNKTPDNCYVYAAQFSKINSKTIGAGCSNLNEMRLFDHDNNNKPFGKLMGFKKGIYNIDFGNKTNMVAYCGGEGQLGYAVFN